MLYDLVQLVDNGKMTEGRPLNRARIALIHNRLGRMLIKQSGAFETYETNVQKVSPTMWWNKERKRIGNPILVAWVAQYWPDQPLSGRIGTYYQISLTALGIAKRPSELSRWLGQSPKSKAFLKKLQRHTGRTADSLKRFAANFDDRKAREAEELALVASSKLRRALALLISWEEDQLFAAREVISERFIDKAAIRRPARIAKRLLSQVEKFAASLAETAIDGSAVPRSAGRWKIWETMVGADLISMGVPKKHVVALLKSSAADPEDERTRIGKNLRRSKKKKVTVKRAVAKKRPQPSRVKR